MALVSYNEAEDEPEMVAASLVPTILTVTEVRVPSADDTTKVSVNLSFVLSWLLVSLAT